MFDYSLLDASMRESANNTKNIVVGLKVLAEVFIGNRIDYHKEKVTGVCVDVYADTSFFDATIYVVESDGKRYLSPAYYYRKWIYPEITEWEFMRYDWDSETERFTGWYRSEENRKYYYAEKISYKKKVEGGFEIEISDGKFFLDNTKQNIH